MKMMAAGFALVGVGLFLFIIGDPPTWAVGAWMASGGVLLVLMSP